MKPCPKFLFALVLAASLPAIAAAADGQPGFNAHFVDITAPEVAVVRQHGENAINRLGSTLVREVSSAIAKDGVESAMDLCHLKSLPVTNGTIAGLPRITAVKLTGLKLRNPHNAPDAAEQLVLDHIQKQLENGEAPSSLLVQRVEYPAAAPEWRVYRPLGIRPECLNCHGDPAEQPATLQAKLSEKYPADQATGFYVGAWRGLIRVTVDNSPPPSSPKAAPKPAPKNN